MSDELSLFAKNQRRIGSSKAKRVRYGNFYFLILRLEWHKIVVQTNVRITEVQRGRYHVLSRRLADTSNLNI